MNVFYFVHSLGSGGIERYSINLYKYIDHSRFEVDFITKSNDNDFFDSQFKQMGGHRIGIVESADIYKPGYIEYIKKLYKIAKSGYDVAYFNFSNPRMALKYVTVCRFAGIKRIEVHSHNSEEDNINIIKKILNHIGRTYINTVAENRLACSDKAAEWMFGRRIREENKYVCIKNGIETSKYRYNSTIREVYRKIYGIKDDCLVIGHVGRFSTQKNHKFLIEVYRRIVDLNPNSKLVLVGIGETMSAIQDYVNELGMQDNVIFLGEQSNVCDIMQMMDVFVLPSLYEGLPVVGIEAQASGLRCVFSSTVSSEADITGNVLFLELDMSEKEWAKSIVDYSDYIRENTEDKIKNAGYDIQSTAETVERILLAD